MSQHVPETREHWNAVVTPTWRATLLSTLVVVLGPVAAMLLVSHPTFGAGVIVGVGLLYSLQVARRIARHRRSRAAGSHRQSLAGLLVKSVSPSE